MEAKHQVRHILLIDDDQEDCEFFDEVIHQIDSSIQLTILNHCNGIVGVLNSIENQPDLLFMDVNLPGKDGIECIRDIKGNPPSRTIKIILYCGVLSKSVIDKGISSGAEAYFVKPPTLKELRELLQFILSTHE